VTAPVATAAAVFSPAGLAAPAAATTVHCLLGHKHVGTALACLGSMLHHTRDPLAVLLHDDGSLTPADVDALTAALPGTSVILRPQADPVVAELLRKYPACAKWRADSNFALKVFDCVAFHAGGDFFEIDSDILFFRPFSNLFRLPPDADALLLTDVEHNYSVRSWNLLASPRLRLGRRVNVGLIGMRPQFIDLDRIEWFLSVPRHRTKFYFLEQTIWSMLAMTCRARLISPRHIPIFTPGLAVDDHLVAAHFVAMHRDHLSRYTPLAREARDPLSHVQTAAVRGCGPLRLALLETKRVCERSMKKIRIRP
jgi:hypothetical protein